METLTKNKLYEGMFLIDSAVAGSNWDGVNNTIKAVLEKAEAQIVSMRKWDDRKMAYEIKGKDRGTYILCYFRADGEKIKDIETSVKLSEQIMRVLILNAEKMTAEDIEKDTPATKEEKETQQVPDDVTKEESEAEQQKIDQEAEKEEVAKQQSIDQEVEVAEEAEPAEETEPTDVAEQEPEEMVENEEESEPRE